MTMHARPLPYDPYNPLPPLPAASQASPVVLHPSPYIPIRVPIFAPVLFINDCIVRVLSLGVRRPNGTAAGHRKTWSESSENVEEGGQMGGVDLRLFKRPEAVGGGRERRIRTKKTE